MIRHPRRFLQAMSAAELLSVAEDTSEISRGNADGERLSSAHLGSSAQPSRKSYVRVFASGRRTSAGHNDKQTL